LTALVGGVLALVGRLISLVGDPVPLVGGALAFVGRLISLVGDPVPLVSGPFPFVGCPIPPIAFVLGAIRGNGGRRRGPVATRVVLHVRKYAVAG
jgi:hypothetical protein